MNNRASAGQRVTVAPFWRGHVHLAPEEYSQLEEVFASESSDALEAALEVLPYLSQVIRHNVQRILSAALVAEHEHGKIVLVEGCRANAIEKYDQERIMTRNLTGSHVGMLVGRALRNTGVISSDVPFEHVSESRCTDWEADVLLDKMSPGEKLIGIAGPYNEPSQERASSVVEKLAKEKKIDAHVYSPEQALRNFHIELNAAQRAIMNASAMTKEEIASGIENEQKPIGIQSISDRLSVLGLKGKHSLMAMLARILPSRWDKKYRE